MNALYTIGYERASREALLDTLAGHSVGLLLDVREVPYSRRPEFRRHDLAAALAARGIDYRWERALGAPKPIRAQVRSDRDYAAFFRRYGEHLERQGGLLRRLAAELAGAVALMCYERDVRMCHRAAVAEALAGRAGLAPVHLLP